MELLVLAPEPLATTVHIIPGVHLQLNVTVTCFPEDVERFYLLLIEAVAYGRPPLLTY